jgi:hypothetical protein
MTIFMYGGLHDEFLERAYIVQQKKVITCANAVLYKSYTAINTKADLRFYHYGYDIFKT